MASDGEDRTAEAESLKNLGNDSYKKGNYREAYEYYTQAIEANPIAPYYGNRAAASMMLSRYEDVISDCDEAIKRDSGFLKAYLRKAKAQLTLGLIPKAIETYQLALLHDPLNSTALGEKRQAELTGERVKRADAYLEKKKYSEALSCLNSALEMASASSAFKLKKARALVLSGKVDDAYALLTQLMRSTNNPEIVYLRGKCLYYQGEFANAIKHIQQALRSDPDNSEYSTEIKKIRSLEAKKQEGNDAFKAGNCQAAIDAYSACLAIDPDNKSFNAILHCNRAAAYSKMGQTKQAVGDCEKAIELDPSYAKAYLRRAQCLRDLGDVEHLEQALRDYEEAGKLLGRDSQRDISNSIRETKLQLKKAKRKDYYKILGISQSADENEIKKAYRKKALEWHPDRWSGKAEDERVNAEKMFKDVGEAYAVLSDPQKKQRYDSGVDLEDLENGGMGGMGGMDPSDLFSMFMGMQGGGFGGHGGHPFMRQSSRGFGGHGGHPFGGFDGGNVRFDFG